MSKNFLQTLAEINAGTFVEELTAAQTELIAAIAKTGGGGKLTLTLEIKPAKGGLTVTVDADVKTKLPSRDRATDFFFIGRDNSLLRDHPDQQRLPLRPVNVDPETGEILDAAPIRAMPATA